jgi:hypothetical protein
MKKYLIKSTLTIAGFIALGVMTGCLKDKDYDNGLTQSTHNSGGDQKIIEIKLTAGDNSNVLLTSFDASNRDTIIDFIPVNLASALPAQEDIKVTLVQNNTLVSNYNTANGTSYLVPPSSMFTLVNGLTVTIPKGSHTGFLQIKLKPSDFVGSDWALGFAIAGIDKPGYLISGNLNTGIVAFGIKNKYDGDYSLRIKTVGWNAFGIADGVTATWPSNIGLITAGANSVSFLDYLRGDDLEPAFTGTTGVPGTLGAPTAFGATTPLFIFDPVTDKLVDVQNTTPDDGRGRFLHLNAAITTSRYDPATKTIYAAYIMTQNGRPDQQIYDTLHYVGPR